MTVAMPALPGSAARRPSTPSLRTGSAKRTQGMFFSADETADAGVDLGTAVVEAIGAAHKSRFTARIPKVTIQVR